MKKFLVCDLDGTLLDQHNHIDPVSLSKLRSYIKTGNDFCVCTGRLDEDIKYVENKLGVKSAYRISQNGAVIRDRNDQLVFSTTIPQRLIPTINSIVFAPGRRVEVSGINHRYFPSPRDASQVAEFVDTSIVKPNLAEFVQNPNFRAVIYLIFGNTEVFQPIQEKIFTAIGRQVNVQQTSPSSLEIFSPEASKGKAVEKIAQKLKLTADQIWVAGDAENDTTMFSLTPHSFAVGSLADDATISAAHQHVATVGNLVDQIMETKI